MFARIVGRTLIIVIWFVTVSVMIMVFINAGAALRYERPGTEHRAFSLEETDYYGKSFPYDPYNAFTIQHLHPFYIFSLPWTQADRNAANNEVVDIDEDGFRRNPNLTVSEK